MMNALKRYIPAPYEGFKGAEEKLKTMQRVLVPEVKSQNTQKLIDSIADVFDLLHIKDGMTLSFHHHLRNGDFVLNMVLGEIKKRGLKNITLAPSAIFPIHEPMVELIKYQQITKIYTNYMNGPVAEAVSQGYLRDLVIMDTHGGRPRAIESGELVIDVAFIAVPTSDAYGHGHGKEGMSACGTLGYAMSDLLYAKHKVVITDHLVDHVTDFDIDGSYVDYVVKVQQIGNPKGILSGTTKPTKDPIQLKIAKLTAKLMDELGYVKPDISFQTGAGGTSLAVSLELKKIMDERHIQGSFASGGITEFLVDMHEKGYFRKLYDVQCFDLRAVESYQKNGLHHAMSASKYGNPMEDQPIVNDLDVVILGATEIDLDFNVNVTTDSHGKIIGGSGGHSDTAHGAKLTIIATNLIKSRMSMVKQYVTTVTTPGESIDCLVTERGIAINPRRQDLLDRLKDSKLPIMTIESLYQKAMSLTGIPKDITKLDRIIGLVRYRDGSIIDAIYQTKG